MFAQLAILILEVELFNVLRAQHLCLIAYSVLLAQFAIFACQDGLKFHNVVNVLLDTLVQAVKIV
jgi:hypothetical protein